MSPTPEGIKNQATAGKAPFAALVLFLFLSLALLLVWLMLLPSMNQKNMLDLFNRHADTAATGVSADVYPRLAEAVSGFLAGFRPTAQMEVEASEGLRAAFSEQERIHLQDVKALVDLTRNLLYASCTLLLLTVLLLLRGFLSNRRPFTPFLIKGLRYAGGVLVLFVMAAGVWGILDFNGAFTFLHRLAFRNELWLLDPRQDLLIQLMPQPFFEEYALRGLKNIGWALAGLVILILGMNLADRLRKR